LAQPTTQTKPTNQPPISEYIHLHGLQVLHGLVCSLSRLLLERTNLQLQLVAHNKPVSLEPTGAIQIEHAVHGIVFALLTPNAKLWGCTDTQPGVFPPGSFIQGNGDRAFHRKCLGFWWFWLCNREMKDQGNGDRAFHRKCLGFWWFWLCIWEDSCSRKPRIRYFSFALDIFCCSILLSTC